MECVINYSKDFKYVELFNQCVKDLEGINIIIKGHISVKHSVSKMNFGLCKYIPNNRFEISINKNLVNIEDVKNTIIHELLHTINPYDGHKGEWKTLANKVGRELKIQITRTSYKELTTTNNDYKYQIICDGCGRTWNYRNYSKTVKLAQLSDRCRCVICNSRKFTVKYN